jgi:hypothetical protein
MSLRSLITPLQITTWYFRMVFRDKIYANFQSLLCVFQIEHCYSKMLYYEHCNGASGPIKLEQLFGCKSAHERSRSRISAKLNTGRSYRIIKLNRLTIMGTPREVARSGWVERESDDAHAHYATAKHYSCSTYTDSLQVTHVLCVCACN